MLSASVGLFWRRDEFCSSGTFPTCTLRDGFDVQIDRLPKMFELSVSTWTVCIDTCARCSLNTIEHESIETMVRIVLWVVISTMVTAPSPHPSSFFFFLRCHLYSKIPTRGILSILLYCPQSSMIKSIIDEKAMCTRFGFIWRKRRAPSCYFLFRTTFELFDYYGRTDNS